MTVSGSSTESAVGARQTGVDTREAGVGARQTGVGGVDARHDPTGLGACGDEAEPITPGAGASLRALAAPIRGLPLLGSALALQRDALGFLQAVDRDRGPMAVFRVGPARWVLASRADAIEDVLVARAGDFDKPAALYGHGRLLFGDALTGLKGAAWRRRRAIVAPAFHRQALRDDAIADAVAEWTDRLADRRAFVLAGELAGLMTQVVCANLLHGADAERMAVPAGAALRAMGARVRIGAPLPDRLPLPPVSTMRRAVTRLHGLYDAAPRRASGDPDLRRNLALLCDEHGQPLLDDAAVRAEINVMVAVGGHQLALALGWALYLLDGHPAVLGALQDELDRVLGGRPPGLQDIEALELTGQVIDETLRLYPPFYLIGREALRDTAVAGWRIPRGATVVLSPWVTQRLDQYFPRPAEFRPQRWTAQLRRELPRAAYLPFGGGPRLCVAQAAARRQLTLALAAIAARHRVRLSSRYAVTPRATTSLEMSPAVMARLERRR